jgi:hypothetical protein
MPKLTSSKPPVSNDDLENLRASGLTDRVPVVNGYHPLYHPLTEAEGRTDVSNAARLVVRHRHVSRWVGSWDKWLIWDGSRWKMDQCLAIDLMAKEIASDLFAELSLALKGIAG